MKKNIYKGVIMDDITKMLGSIVKVCKVLSYGLNAIAEKASEIEATNVKEEQKKEKPVEVQVEKPETIIPSKKISKKKIAKTSKNLEKSASKKNSKKLVPGKTMSSTILDIINNSSNSVSVAYLEEKTGFGHRSILDLVHMLKKKGKIKGVKKGLYTKI
ncbi:MAG: hypothetical protein HQK79_13170 [Desulfobacterales bacterium]|nr:hypothetical protein [Desulfobacterales bacterium]MBF0397073.1 hypothetical protein [Desulfobacterales bacterium]